MGRGRYVENEEFVKFVRRIIQGYGRRVADQADVEALDALLALRRDVDEAIASAVAGLRSGPTPYSWADIGKRAGITRQSAHERWASARTAS
jgi:hypothetical protein